MSPALVVVLVDREEALSKALSGALDGLPIRLTLTATSRGAVEAASDHEGCLVILPASRGGETIPRLRQVNPTGRAVVMADLDSSLVSQCLEAGADEVVLTQPSQEAALRQIRRVVESEAIRLENVCLRNDLDSLKQRVRSRYSRARPGGAGPLLDPEEFRVAVEEECERAARFAVPTSLLLVRVQGFEGLRGNDSALERAWTQVADLIRADLRCNDAIAWMTPEQAAVLLPDTAEPGAVVTAERLRQAAMICPIDVGLPNLLRIRFSIGLATFPTHANDAASLFRRARESLQRACAAVPVALAASSDTSP